RRHTMSDRDWSSDVCSSDLFFTGAFRKPREINCVLRVTLLLVTIGIGFAGYSLPDDLLSGTGLRIAYSIALSIPFIGTWLAFLRSEERRVGKAWIYWWRP